MPGFIFLLMALLSCQCFGAVFGVDDRVEVTSKKYPWIAIGKLSSGGSICTATLIGPCQILTAAHCVISEGTQKPYNYTMSFTSSDGVTTSRLINSSIQFGMPSDFVKIRNHDWAIAILEESIGQQLSWFQPQLIGPSNFPLMGLNIAGYNRDIFGGKSLSVDNHVVLHEMQKTNMMLLEANTLPGSSGAAIWYLKANPEIAMLIGVSVAVAADAKTLSPIAHIDKYNLPQSAQGISTAQFWNEYIRSLNMCPPPKSTVQKIKEVLVGTPKKP